MKQFLQHFIVIASFFLSILECIALLRVGTSAETLKKKTAP